MDVEYLRNALNGPKSVIHRLYTEVYRKILKNDGLNIMEQDWDNLLVLDACRYDLFSEECDIDGDLKSVISPGSHTVEYLRKTFQNRQFNDTVYVSATPQLEWVGLSNAFYDTIQVWKEGWDENLNTVPPSVVCKAAHKALAEYPNKRLIVHFVQPHFPFIGSTGKKIRNMMSIRSGFNGEDKEIPTVWDSLEQGLVSEALVWQAYRENLEIVLDHAEQLVYDLKGKTILTSDHGNAFGEYGLYGHPGGKAIDSLIRVPWLEIEGHERRRITSEMPIREQTEVDQEELQQRLSDLGYK